MTQLQFPHQPPRTARWVSGFMLGALALVMTTWPVQASEKEATSRITRTHSLEWGSTARLTVVNGVGEMVVRLGSTEKIELQVKIRGDRSWFGGRRDVGDVDIEIERRGDQLRLALEEDKISGDWQITLPRKMLGLLEVNSGVGDLTIEAMTAKLEVDLGVGEVDARVANGVIDIDVGVGDIEIVTQQATAGAVRGSVGVGQVTITGEGVNSRGRGVVQVGAAGKGDKDIVAAAGVGDIDIRLE